MHGPQTFDVIGPVATFWIWGPTKQGVILMWRERSTVVTNDLWYIIVAPKVVSTVTQLSA